jgi:hypothetical protein
MSRKLTPDQIAQYERDGYVCPVDAFSPGRAAPGTTGCRPSSAPRARR